MENIKLMADFPLKAYKLRESTFVINFQYFIRRSFNAETSTVNSVLVKIFSLSYNEREDSADLRCWWKTSGMILLPQVMRINMIITSEKRFVCE